ncbi:Tryptophan-specific transport protein [Candidatus Arsenophonus lipoptenae]|uniref:Aromatic amino acid permease n=1 Tax=Candidatus Arsenophonus lipoptenae TaxID=634113 RepID=A0A0X8CY23_9GAMM|nr:aromatic amino acid transporter [Candidatus Arsenophonus lipoptenae]AMA64977.1 Tryptophan-specific transport protein [Candidatus Arsenophonus lipoptenae]
MQYSKRPFILSGTMIITGTTVGAGMLSIPIVTAGVWFIGSIILLAYTWICLFFSGLMILEVNMNYPIGTSFHTMVKDLLGTKWNILNSMSIMFVLYILTYAYISAGGKIIAYNFDKIISINYTISSILFGLLISFIIWLPTKVLGRLSIILICGMMVFFIIFISEIIKNISFEILFNQNDVDKNYFYYTFIALPYLLTSFGYHGNIPGLIKYYNGESKAVILSILNGTFIALVIYVLWQFTIQGNISRISFKEILFENANVDSLLRQINCYIKNNSIKQCLNIFSYMAIISSCLGVTLGLFDFLTDFLKFKDNNIGRLQSVIITFTPPIILTLCYPNGFIHAIGFTGLAATIWAVIVPAMMMKASRKKFPSSVYYVPKGKILFCFVISYGLMNEIIQILSMFNILPVYN